MLVRLVRALALSTLVAAPAFAAGSFDLRHSIDLADHRGQTFFDVMTMPDGIKSHMDRDFTGAFTIADKDVVFARAKSLDPSVHRKVASFFKNGEQGLAALIDALAGQTTTPQKLRGLVAERLDDGDLLKQANEIGLAAVTVAPYLALASGAGTSVHLDERNHYLNIGYAPGSDDAEQLAKDVKTGRSFGASAKHPALDASDRFYLGELESYLKGTDDPTAFYAALMSVLTSSDASGLQDLVDDSQTVATDFLAVYTAELDRHVMAKLGNHPWENDLAEATLVSAYVTASGRMIKDGKLAAGKPGDFFGVGRTGTGIGITRKDRYALQRAVVKAEGELHPELIAELETLTGTRKGGDVIHGLMLFLNNYSTQSKVRANAAALRRDVAELAAAVAQDADKITASLEQP